MNWAGLADLANVAVREVFSEATDAIVYTPSGGSAESIEAVYDDKWERVVVQGGLPHVTTGPVVDIRLADVSQTPQRGETISARGTTYLITEVEENGHGAVKCHLSEQ